MGSGIVSIDLSLGGHETLSRVLLVLTAVLWAGLVCVVVGRALFRAERWRAEAGSPASLTAVAGTAVLGIRVVLLGRHALGYALLVFALVVWLVLVPYVLRAWRTPTVGVSFVLAVSTESLAVLGAILAARDRIVWLAVASLVALALGLLAYAFVAVGFDLRQLLTGRGDHWVAGGALAIATLACGRAAQAAESTGTLHGWGDGIGTASLALWAAAFLWLPALLACEAARPRTDYDARRWSTVFPVGMYAACSFVVGDVEKIDGLVDFARVWTWIGLAVWCVVFAGLLRRGYALSRGRTAG